MSEMGAIITTLCSLVMVTAIFLILRVLYLIYLISTTECRLEKLNGSLQTVFCVGSGGHTTEMLRLSRNLDFQKYQPRLYIMSDNDINSEVKIRKFDYSTSNYSLAKIPRSRNVGQSYLTSVFSTFYATIYTIPVIYNFKPNIIFCNGPGTCVPACLVAFIMRCLFIIDCRIVFIESICRVRGLSLTGKILQYFADIIVVQWPQLRDCCYRAKYFGRLT